MQTEIARRYCTQKEWDEVQNVSFNEKYFLAMILGSEKALHMLLPSPVESPKKRRKDDVVAETYQQIGDPTTSTYAICFSMHSIMKAIFDPCFDLILNLLCIATDLSGWQNSDIRQNIQKLTCIQNLLSQSPEIPHAESDTKCLGHQVCFLYIAHTRCSTYFLQLACSPLS